MEHLPLDTDTGAVRITSSGAGTPTKPIDFGGVSVIGLPSVGSGVDSVFGRTGTVVAQINDYTFSLIGGKATYAQIQNVSATSVLLGRGDASIGSVQEISVGGTMSISGTTLNVGKNVISVQTPDDTPPQDALLLMYYPLLDELRSVTTDDFANQLVIDTITDSITGFGVTFDTSFLTGNHSVRLPDGNSTTVIGSTSRAVGKFTTGVGTDGVVINGYWDISTGTQFTAQQDNFTPASSTYYLRMSSDGTQNITGLVGSGVGGETHVFECVSNSVVIKHESASSTASNRFHNSSSADITLTAGQCAYLFYDATVLRWAVSAIGGGSGGGGGTGDVVGPAGATDTAIPVFDGTTGKLIKNTALLMSAATGSVTWPDNVRQLFNPGATVAGINVGSVTSAPSTPANGDLWYDSTGDLLKARVNGVTVSLGAGTVTPSGTLTAGRLIVGAGAAVIAPSDLTGDVTTSGSVATTLINIPSATTMAGTLLVTAIAAPGTPAAGKGNAYLDSTSKNWSLKNDAGTVNHGVQSRTATASNWIRSIADNGSSTISQPDFTDLTGTITTTQGAPLASATITLSNKRITPRALSTAGPGATPTINTDSYDVVHFTALAAAITSMTTNLSGTPVEGDQLRIDFTDNGTARAITWGASFEAGASTLPTTTVISTRLDTNFFWNTATSKWRCMATSEASGASGTVTSFSAGDLSPVFTSSVATASTTPALTFALTSAAATTVFGRAAGSSGAPTYSSAPQFLKIGNLTTNGFVKTGSGDGTLSIDTVTYADNAFKTISVSGQSDVVADSATDTLTLVAGTNVTITTNASTDTITITAAGGGGGTPGGSNTQVQYNNSSAFGGITGATTDGTTLTLVAPVLGTPASGTLTNCTGLPVAGITASTVTALGVGSIELGAATDTTIARSGAGDITVEGNRIFRVGGADVPVADGGTGLSSGTSGGVLGYTATGTLASSALLAANAIMIGGGAGATPTTTTTGTGVLTAIGNTANATGGVSTVDGTATLTNKRVTKRVTSTSGPGATPTINTDNADAVHLTALAAAITSMTTNLSGTPTEGQYLRIDFTDNGTARAITWGATFEASGNVALPTTTVISTRLDVGFVWNTVTSKWRCIATA